jgi:hypothetical protein
MVLVVEEHWIASAPKDFHVENDKEEVGKDPPSLHILRLFLCDLLQ